MRRDSSSNRRPSGDNDHRGLFRRSARAGHVQPRALQMSSGAFTRTAPSASKRAGQVTSVRWKKVSRMKSLDRKSVVSGQGVYVSSSHGGRSDIKTKKKKEQRSNK